MATADPGTLATWEDVVRQDTENIGRIWTDKTVSTGDIQLPASSQAGPIDIAKGDSDFLIGLSALSSTSNVATTSNMPLDIVLVLDTSGSMGDSIMSGYEYVPAYDVSTNGWTTYYALSPDGTYAQIDRITSGWGPFPSFDHWELDGQTVEPMTGAADEDPAHIQFYTRSWVNVSKMDALKTAANNFIDATAEQNAGIDDAARQHRVSIVSFASSGNLRQSLTECTDANKESLKAVIDGLSASGATAADYGMNQAKQALASSREDAVKVVVFFTDGEPNHGSGFTESVANDAIAASGELKDEGTLVYSVGVFEAADPGNTDTSTSNRFNAYMHAMSSNYPDATAWNGLGERAEDSDYYKAATNADELDAIFQEISEEISKGSGFPTEVTEGAAGTSGYIAFTDELGAYMQVDEFKQLVFADREFTATSSTEDDTVTYTYTGDSGGNALYPEGNVDDIVVQVKRSDDLAQGDIVTVKIPAGLIPLRDFEVKSDDSGITLDIDEAYPLRVFYGVSVKPGVAEALRSNAADQELLGYIADNTEGGKTSFYSNLFDGTVTSGDKVLGNTTASFVPAEGNAFYYFTEDTTLYTDEDCANALKEEPRPGETYYYKRLYYAKDPGTGEVTQKEGVIRFVHATFEASTTFWDEAADGTYYVKAGAPRLTRVDDLTLTKTLNATGTATEVINPHWDNINNPNVLNVSLGNNGKIDVELPGTLAIAKDARVAPNKGLSADVLDGKSFEFAISIPDAANETLKAEVKDEQGGVTAQLFDLAFDAQGKATHSIKAGETLCIYGIDAGSAYEVSEVASSMPAGFTQTNVTGDTGTIAGNAVSEAKFENTYDVASVTVGADDFARYAKEFDRWDIEGSFVIQLKESNAANPMPEGSEDGADGLQEKNVQVAEGSASGSFGDVTFDAAGTYAYVVMEKTPSSTVAGMTYSDAAYTVEVVVTDNGKGALEATSKMVKTSDDAGIEIEPHEEVADKTASFVNVFDVDSVSAGPLATKSYVNNGGADKDLKDDMFRFKVRPVGANADSAPLPAGAQPDEDGYIYVTNEGPSVAFGQAVFTADHVGKTYEYEISEVLPDGANADNGYTVDGMTYDPDFYTACFHVTSEEVSGVPTVDVEVTYSKGELGTAVEGIPVFDNSYDPVDVTLAGDAAIKASKTLNGRDSLDGEGFGFTLAARGSATQAALANGAVVFGDDEGATELKASVGELSDGQAKSAGFGPIRFAKPGTYTFSVVEDRPADGNGMVYDKHTETVTVNVVDDGGVLEAAVSYSSGGDAAAFVNAYAAQASYSADMDMTVGKTLDGRSQIAGEFEFAIEGVASSTVGADEAHARLAASDKSFKTIAGAPSGVQSQMFDLLGSLEFTQADAGKTFSYQLSEVAGALGGVTYDAAVYRIDIAVIDDGDGTMHTATTIGKTAADGTTEQVGTYDGSDGLDRVTLGFANAYKPASVAIDTAAGTFFKELQGRDWAEGDEFGFTLTPLDGAPLPDGADEGADEAIATVKAQAGTLAGEKVPFGFGTIGFDAAGTYRYEVRENAYDIAGMKPQVADQVATMTIAVTDDGAGKLSAAVATVEAGTFVNVYESGTVDVDAAGGVQVVKTMTGRAIAAGDFEFTMTPVNDDARDKFGADARTVRTAGAALGNAGDANVAKETVRFATGMTFTQADAGKTFAFEVAEKDGGSKGYTYDPTVHELAFSVNDDVSTGTLMVEARLDDAVLATWSGTTARAAGDAASIPFANSYDAGSVVVGGEDGVALEAAKVLTGRPMAEGEFRFDVVNAADTDGQPAVVTTGVNDAAGTVLFGGITYTTGQLNRDVAAGLATVDRTGDADVYTYVYTVIEDVAALDEGVVPVTGTQAFTVKVTDDRAGTLEAEVVYPDGGMVFENAYGAGATAELTLCGTKVLKVESGDNAPDIAGRFQFALAGSAGAPLPDTTTATNDAAGNVSFGKITFTMEGVFGEDAEAAEGGAADGVADEAGVADGGADALQPASAMRTKTFVYTVSESGSVPGVTNDAEAKTIEVTVTDNGDGTLSVRKSAADAAPDFTFANVYRVSDQPSSPTGAGGLTIEKTLVGRDLRAGEFCFELASTDTGEVFTATNDAAGSVSFPEIVFDGPGVFAYELTEVAGDAGGVTYDAASYDVTATAVDDGAGALDVTWAVSKGGAAIDDKAVTFENSYEAAPTSIAFNAAKVLDGRDIVEGEFAFELRGADGTVLQTAENGAAAGDGFAPVGFDPIDFETPGEYDYQLVEVQGDAEGVTYDTTVFAYHVVVADDGSGQLEATWTEGDAGAPVFRNGYSASVPGSSELPGGALVKTGDGRGIVLAGIAVLALVAAIAVGFGAWRMRRR